MQKGAMDNGAAGVRLHDDTGDNVGVRSRDLPIEEVSSAFADGLLEAGRRGRDVGARLDGNGL